MTSQQGVINGLVQRLLNLQAKLLAIEERNLAKTCSNDDLPDVDKMLDQMSIFTVSEKDYGVPIVAVNGTHDHHDLGGFAGSVRFIGTDLDSETDFQ